MVELQGLKLGNVNVKKKDIVELQVMVNSSYQITAES